MHGNARAADMSGMPSVGFSGCLFLSELRTRTEGEAAVYDVVVAARHLRALGALAAARIVAGLEIFEEL